MVWVRKALASLLLLVLFVCLLGTALSTSANLTLAKPQKIETWLNQSNLYQSFLTNATTQAKKAVGSSEDQGSVTLSDSAVQQAAGAAFTNQNFQTDLNTFLNSNYAWLEGKTAQPNFTIDLTSQKQEFARQISQYVQDHIASLPVCTTQQLIAIGSAANIDPLNITCRPATLDAKAESDIVAQKIESNSNFLSNPVVTANNINPNGGSTSEPYYQKYSSLPKLYKFAVKLPIIYSVIALLSALGVIFLAARKRSGLRQVAGTLLVSGILLVIVKLLGDSITTQIDKKLFNQTSDGQLQQSLTHFVSLLEAQLTKIDLWFGLGYIALALVIFALLALMRGRTPKVPKTPEKTITFDDSDSIASRLNDAPRQASPRPPEPLRPPQPEEPTGPPPRPKRPPRLIQ